MTSKNELLKRELLKKAEAYCAENKTSFSTVGREVMNDSSILHRLKRGSDLSTGNFEKIAEVVGLEISVAEDCSIIEVSSHG